MFLSGCFPSVRTGQPESFTLQIWNIPISRILFMLVLLILSKWHKTFFFIGGGGGGEGFQLRRSLQNSAFHLQINQDLACGVSLTSTYMTKWYEYKYSEKLNKYLYQIKIMRVMIKKIPVGAGPT